MINNTRKKISVLLLSFFSAAAYADDGAILNANGDTTVTINFSHDHLAKSVNEIYQAHCEKSDYVLELSFAPKKLILRIKDENGNQISNDLSDTQLAKDWLNGRYLWRPVFLCTQDKLGSALMLNLQGIDLNGGRSALQVVSAYSQIENNAQIKKYQSVSLEERNHLFNY